MSGLRAEKVVTSGIFALDGGEWQVDNNIWLVGDDDQVVVIDAAHDAGPIIEAVGGREVAAIICTHAHNDHVTVAPQLVKRLDAPVLLHPDDLVLWNQTHPAHRPESLDEGAQQLGPVELQVIHTPGHSPGSCVIHVPELGVLFSGDTLFQGGPGATGRSYSSFETIIDSLRDKVLTLPAETVVHTGHGDDTTIGDEAPHLQEWIDRGH